MYDGCGEGDSATVGSCSRDLGDQLVPLARWSDESVTALVEARVERVEKPWGCAVMDLLEKDDERLEKDGGIWCGGVDPVPPPTAADGVGKPANGIGEAAEEGEAGADRGDGGTADAGARGTPPGME